MLVELKTIFNRLIGAWTLDRQTIDRSSGNEVHGHLAGQAVFSLIDDTKLLCEESGIFRFGGNETNASRSYIYEMRDGKILILYNDPYRKGDVLHELNFEKNGNGFLARHCHLCGSDTYDVEIFFADDSAIQINYVIKGPHKDYEMKTTLMPK